MGYMRKTKNVGFGFIDHDITVNGESLVFCLDCRKWITEAKAQACHSNFTKYVPCHSYKAFRRHVRKHKELPAGEPIYLVQKNSDHWFKNFRLFTK